MAQLIFLFYVRIAFYGKIAQSVSFNSVNEYTNEHFQTHTAHVNVKT